MRCILLLTLAALFTGCASYATPGRPADMALFGASENDREQLTDVSIRAKLTRKPLAQFPAAIAVVHVQGSGYRARNATTYGHGAYTVVTSRESKTEQHLQRLTQLPLVSAVAPVNRLLLPAHLQSDRELRSAAASLHADITLVYTLDTTFRIGDMDSPVDVITLGFLPSKRAYVTTTASAAFLDTRNGYVYGVAEATATHSQMANNWTSEQAVDQSRQQAESKAMEKLIDEIEKTWSNIIRQRT